MSHTPLEQPEQYWFARHSKSIVFLILILTVAGIYEALLFQDSLIRCIASGF
jgi:hypothetical protein